MRAEPYIYDMQCSPGMLFLHGTGRGTRQYRILRALNLEVVLDRCVRKSDTCARALEETTLWRLDHASVRMLNPVAPLWAVRTIPPPDHPPARHAWLLVRDPYYVLLAPDELPLLDIWVHDALGTERTL